jgi:hypothetical protein
MKQFLRPSFVLYIYRTARPVQNLLHHPLTASYSILVALNPVPSSEVRSKLILGSYSRTWSVEHAVLQKKKTSAVKALLETVIGSRCIVQSGKVRGENKYG